MGTMAKGSHQFGYDNPRSVGIDGDGRNILTRSPQFGEDLAVNEVKVERREIDPRAELGMQLEKIAASLETSPKALLDYLRKKDQPEAIDSIGAPGGPGGAAMGSSRNHSKVIRNRTQVIRTSAAIISALDDVLNYNPKTQHNQIPPELWRDNPEYIAALKRIADELKSLNDMLKRQTTAQNEHNTVVDLGIHINKFLSGFAGVAGKGAGWLLIASLGGLLYQTGLVPDLAENVFKHLKLPK
jgi:hypothetical protein